MPTMVEYLDRIAALCEQEGIELILVKTPTTDFSEGQHNTLQQYAEEQDIAFYDFNEESLYNELDFDFNLDSKDYGHMNYSGAVKITNAIGAILSAEFGLRPHQDEQWEAAKIGYANALINYELTGIVDLDEYLTVLKNNIDRYTIFIAAQDEASSSLSETSQTLLQGLGLTADWTDAYRNSYCAVIDGGNILVEAMSSDVLFFEGAFLDGSHTYSISSGGFYTGESCSIMLDMDGVDDVEYAQQVRGLNIVIYDNDSCLLVDSVSFDTYDWEYGVHRTSYY